jgi:hypothetical protein
MITGSCLCGGVRYAYDGTLDEISMCHCRQCQKAQGTAFVAVSPIDAERFRLVAGAELLRSFRATPDKARVFCGRCGSPIYSARDDLPKVKRLRLGTVDTPIHGARAYHIHTASRASWHAITDDHPQWPGAPAS